MRTSPSATDIVVVGACEHNLKNVTVAFKKNVITTVTGLSGSGKSSLVFDTLLSEAQRRFFLTLSHYARQFLGQERRAKVRRIDGVAPAVGLRQNEVVLSRRSSVATEVELGELVGLYYARYGRRLCPTHGVDTARQSASLVAERIATEFAHRQVAVCAPVVQERRGQYRKELEGLAVLGFSRAVIDGVLTSLFPLPNLSKSLKHSVSVVVDVVVASDARQKRLQRAMATALELEPNQFCVIPLLSATELDLAGQRMYSLRDGCPVCSYTWGELEARHFSPNSLGRCPGCSGLGEEGDGWDATECPPCRGTGINPSLGAICEAEQSILDIYQDTLEAQAAFWQRQMKPLCPERDAGRRRLLEEILARLDPLCQVGLGYLQLKRRLPSLSGGEYQRLRLSNLFSQHLRGMIYVLDEPSQGLHPSEIAKLMASLRRLCQQGNTVILVDHDEQVMAASDAIVELGPGGGRTGGEVVAQFQPEAAAAVTTGVAAADLTRYRLVPQRRVASGPAPHVPPLEDADYLHLIAPRRHALSVERVAFRRGALNVVGGVSGAGKSTLVFGCFAPLLAAHIGDQPALPESFGTLHGAQAVTALDVIDRGAMGRSSLSMPLTYLGAFTLVRELYAALPEAQILGLRARDFSLQTTGGRCEVCAGRGMVDHEMKFLPTARSVCDACDGRRYSARALSVTYRGATLGDVLAMTLEEAAVFFSRHRKITRRIEPAIALGLGYLQLGQAVHTLSGGEGQRLKIATYLNKQREDSTCILMDEPTQGLATQDVRLLLAALAQLTARGVTLVVTEHHHAVIEAADVYLELGPGAAREGGKLTVFETRPRRPAGTS